LYVHAVVYNLFNLGKHIYQPSIIDHSGSIRLPVGNQYGSVNKESHAFLVRTKQLVSILRKLASLSTNASHFSRSEISGYF